MLIQFKIRDESIHQKIAQITMYIIISLSILKMIHIIILHKIKQGE